jgi:hypothetical protein
MSERAMRAVQRLVTIVLLLVGILPAFFVNVLLIAVS